MPAKKLVVSAYLQYVPIGVVALLLFALTRQLGGVLLTFLLAGVLAHVLSPLVRWPEGRGIPRVLAVLGVFAALVAVILFALFVLIVPAAGQVQALIRDPQVVVDGAAALVDRIRDLPYVGERVAALDQEALSAGVHPLGALFATRAATTFYGMIGAIFAVPIVAIVAAVFRYLRGALIFEHWHKAPVVAVDTAGGASGQTTLEDASLHKAPAGVVPAGNPGGPPRGEWSTREGE